jgi:hypothetical protein
MSEDRPGYNRKAPKSATKAKPNERRRGSRRNRPGSASGSGRVVFSEATTKSLRNKVAEHNEQHGETAGKRVTLSMLKAVYRRGAGAFSTSHSPAVRSREQWAQARVNAFLRLVASGTPRNPKYTTDNDLLPRGHRRSTRGKK